MTCDQKNLITTSERDPNIILYTGVVGKFLQARGKMRDLGAKPPEAGDFP